MELRRSEGAPEGFPFEERSVRHWLGLNKDDARAVRRTALQEGDWCVFKKRLYLAEGAVRKMAAKIEKTRGGSNGSDCGAVKTAPKEAPAVVTLQVVSARLKNARLLMACAPGDDLLQPKKPLRVRVRSQKHFVPGMEIPARLVDGYEDLYDLARNCPRTRGKW